MINGYDNSNIQGFEYEKTSISNGNILGTCELGKATIKLLNDSNEYSNLKSQWIKTIHGSFYIYDVKPVQETISIQLDCYDIKYKLDVKYDKSKFEKLFPMTLKQWRNKIFEECDVLYDNSDFPNSNLMLDTHPFVEDDASCRNVLCIIAQAGASWIDNDEKDKFYFRWFSNVVHTIDDWSSLTTEKEPTMPINAVVLGRGDAEDNVVWPQTEPQSKKELRIDNNYILDPQDTNSQTDRRYSVIQPIYNRVKGFKYIVMDIDCSEVRNKLSINIGDKIKYKDIWGNDLETYIMSKTINFLGGDPTLDENYEVSFTSENISETSTEFKYGSSVPNQILNVNRRCDKLNGQISDTIDRVGVISKDMETKTQATGYPIYIDKAGNYNAENLVVYGNSYQDGTPTTSSPKKVESIQIITNLFGSELEQGGIDTNGNPFETTTRIRAKDLIEVTGKQMIFSFKGNLRFNYACYDTNGGLLGVDSTWKDSGTIFTPLANTKYLKLFFSNKSDVNANVSVNDISDIQLEYGSFVHKNVPYGSWLVTKTRSKNLLNYLNINSSINGITNVVNEDGSITTTGKPNASYTKVIPITWINNLLVNGEKYTFSIKEKNTDVSIQMRLTNKETGAKSYLGGESYQSMVFTANTDLYDYDIYIQLGQSTNYPEAINVTNFYQLEKGDKATPFEKFEEHTSLTDLNIYDDEGNIIGRHELIKCGDVCDEVDIVTGKLIKRIGKYVVTGDENKSNSAADYQSDNCYLMFFRNSIDVKSNKLLCNYFEVDSSGNNANFQKIPNLVKTINTTNALVVFNFPKPLVNNLTEATNWFKEKYNSGNPVEIYYQLQEPIEYQVRTQPLELFEDINTVFVNSDIPPYRLDLTYLTKSTLNGTYATHNELKMTEDSISSTLNKKIMDEKEKTISEVEINTKQQIKDNNEAYVSTEITRKTTDAINNLKIGGTNYISHLPDNWLDNKSWGTPNVGEDVVLQTKTGRISLRHRIEIKPNTDYYLKLYSSKDVQVLFRVCDENDKFIGSIINLVDKSMKFATNAKYIRVVVYNNVSVDDIKNGTIKIKLEEGNKPTDWSLAPKDVDSQFETITHQTNDIKQEVTDTKNSISIKVSEGIEKLQIGGTNLGRKGCISAYYDGDTNINLTTTNFSKDGSFEFKRIKNIQNGGVMLDRYVDYEVDKHYIIHFDLKLANNTSGSTINRYFNVYNGLGHKNSRVYVDGEVYKDSAGNEVGFTKNILVPDGNYHNIRLEFDAVSSSVDKDKINTNHIILQPYKQDTNLYTAQVKEFKIEKGDKATDWSPAPDDKLNTSKFTKAEILTEINNGVSSITLDADVINSDGLTTFMNNKLKNAGQTTINGANITTGTIDASKVIVKNLDASKITTGTLSADKISGGSITGSSINLGDGKFKVDTNGKLTATSGTIGGWNIGSTALTNIVGDYKVTIANGTDSVQTILNIKDNVNNTYPFNLKADGTLKAEKGNIGGWIISPDRLSKNAGRYAVGLLASAAGNDPNDAVFHVWDSTNEKNTFYVTNAGYLYAQNADITGAIHSSSGQIGGLTINGSDGLKSKHFSVTPNGQLNLYPQVGAGGVYLFNDGMRLNSTLGMSIASSSDGNRKAPSAGGIDIMACSGTDLYLACKLGSDASGTGSSITLKNGEIHFFVKDNGTIYKNGSTIHSSSKNMKENIKLLTNEEKNEIYDIIKNIPLKKYDYKKKYGTKFHYGFVIEDIENTKLGELLHIVQAGTDKNVKTYDSDDLDRIELIVIQELMKRIEKLEEKLCQ